MSTLRLLFVFVVAACLMFQPFSAYASVLEQDAGTADLTPQELYTRIGPSIPLVETDDALGSGVLIQRYGKQYVVTNYHVVWPYASAVLVFPDGTELFDVPVIDWDLIADLAVLGPVEVDVTPLNISAKREVVVGDIAYLIGYPNESEWYPQPTLSQGIIARIRNWSTANLSYYQTDAEIAGGQSGGALVAPDGSIIGISTYLFGGEGTFALALAAEDVLRRVDGILRGRDVDGLGERFRIRDDEKDGGKLVINRATKGGLDYLGDVDIFTISLEEGETVTVWTESLGVDPYLSIGPADGHQGDLVTDDDSGVGLFGLDAELVYDVPADGEYMIMVQDASAAGYGGYFLGVEAYVEE